MYFLARYLFNTNAKMPLYGKGGNLFISIRMNVKSDVIFYLMLFFLNSSVLHLARALLLLFNRRGPKRKVERNETEPCKIRRRRSPRPI